MKRSRFPSALVTWLLVTLGSLTASGCFGRVAFIGVGTAIDVLPHGYVSVMVGTNQVPLSTISRNNSS